MAHTGAQLSGSGAQLSGSGAQLSGSGAQLSAISAYLHTSYLGAQLSAVSLDLLLALVVYILLIVLSNYEPRTRALPRSGAKLEIGHFRPIVANYGQL